jgi:hypothetical protein
MAGTAQFTIGAEACCSDGACGEVIRVDPAEETQFIPGTISYPGYGPGQVSYWPYYGIGAGGTGTAGAGLGGNGMSGRGMAGQNPSQTVTWASIPPGEVEIRRGDHVQATDGHIGRVQGLVIDRRSGHVIHVLLQEGHLWGRRKVASSGSGTGSG